MSIRVLQAASLGLAACVVAACAPQPEQIVPAAVSPQLYADLTCPQLVTTQARLNRHLAALSTEQTQASVDDAVGVVFTWRPLASLSGGNLQDSVALAKGRLALVNQRLTRQCQG